MVRENLPLFILKRVFNSWLVLQKEILVMYEFIILMKCLALLFALIVFGINKAIFPSISSIKNIAYVLYLFSAILFLFTFLAHGVPHYQNIDPIAMEGCYSPVSDRHGLTIYVFHVLYITAQVAVTVKKLKLPPLVIMLFVSLLIIGIVLNGFFIHHISIHDVSRVYPGISTCFTRIGLSLYPVSSTIISIQLLVSLVRNKAYIQVDKEYKNKFLNSLNLFLLRSNQIPLVSTLLSLPVFIIIVLILLLCGQEVDSFEKAFSDTATWRYSQKIHPPIVSDRHGHYLCTVSSCGHPAITRPLRLGKSNNRVIIVNRQLQIANAFEEVLYHMSPRIHRIVRKGYDNYGYNLSRKINNEFLSTLTYLLMKPLEWFFLIVVYSYYIEPEEVINRQYRAWA